MAAHREPAASGSALLLSAVAGAAIGAAGLGWWLLREAEARRRSIPAPRRQPRADLPESAVPSVSAAVGADPRLQDRVQQLNQAIDEVRRQLEELQPRP
ncbi:MAG: hypothetical protein VKO65_00440 [Cyanobacteriota bacterium]|nr:hypothetical protein [Cyanobacteriota bacterium]